MVLFYVYDIVVVYSLYCPDVVMKTIRCYKLVRIFSFSHWVDSIIDDRKHFEQKHMDKHY